MAKQFTEFKLMSYNIGGARRDWGSKREKILQVIKEIAPDILAIQESTEWEDADNNLHSDSQIISEAGGFGSNYYFGPTLSMTENFQVRKENFVDAIFSDWRSWVQGNSIFSKSPFVRFGDPMKVGTPTNIPIFTPAVYEGTRDTDPRYAIMARIQSANINPFVIGTHFTTLVGERLPLNSKMPTGSAKLSKLAKNEEAEIARYVQAKRILDLLRSHVLENREVAFLLGDFNATGNEPSISSVIEKEGGFVRLIPENSNKATHIKESEPIDHIFVYPADRIIDYSCQIVKSDLTDGTSDHWPVVANISIQIN